MPMVAAADVKSGQRIKTSRGVVKVLNSNPTRGGAATTWEVCGYAEGKPTWRFIGDPNFEFEVVKPNGGNQQ